LDKIVGFEEIGNTDDFQTIGLARRLVKGKMITPSNKAELGEFKLSKKGKGKGDQDDLDY
jgi:hypothetical protein